MNPRHTPSRRQFLRAGAASLAVVGAVLPWVPAFGPALAQERFSVRVLLPVVTEPIGALVAQNAGRARDAYDALQAHFYRPQVVPGEVTPLYLEQSPQGDAQPYSYEWPFSQALGAVLDTLGLPSSYAVNADAVQNLIRNALPRYWDGTGYASYPVPPLGGGGDRFFDDNAWAGLDLLRAYHLTGDTAALTAAQKVFRYLTTGWDDDANHAFPGGVFWVDADWQHTRNTCSTAPSAELALRLFQATQQQSYLTWGQKMYGWVDATLRDADGLYWDHIGLDGDIQRTKWSYNQGTMIGAGALLYAITHDAAYLDRAKATAAAALAYYTSHGYATQSPAFNAIFFRNLLHLSIVDSAHLSATQAALQGYADQLWRTNRTSAGLYAFPPGSGVVKLLGHSAAIQIFACLAWDPSRYDLLV